MIKRLFRTREESDRQIEPLRDRIKELERSVRNYKRRFRKATRALTRVLGKFNNLKQLLDIERLARLEHRQWVAWSKAVADEVSEERRARWESLWIPYDELPEKVKEQDRVWARKILAGFEE